MEQFNLEKYLKNPSRKVVTRNGRNVRIICTDKKGYEYPIVALIENKLEGFESALYYTKDGEYTANESSMSDLFFSPEKHEGWINLFKGNYANSDVYLGDFPIYSSKEIAELNGRCCRNYLSTIKIEWED